MPLMYLYDYYFLGMFLGIFKHGNFPMTTNKNSAQKKTKQKRFILQQIVDEESLTNIDKH